MNNSRALFVFNWNNSNPVSGDLLPLGNLSSLWRCAAMTQGQLLKWDHHLWSLEWVEFWWKILWKAESAGAQPTSAPRPIDVRGGQLVRTRKSVGWLVITTLVTSIVCENYIGVTPLFKTYNLSDSITHIYAAKFLYSNLETLLMLNISSEVQMNSSIYLKLRSLKE